MNSNFFFFSIASLISFPFFKNLKSSVTPRGYSSLNITFLASDINILSSRCTSYYGLAMSSSFQLIYIFVNSCLSSTNLSFPWAISYFSLGTEGGVFVVISIYLFSFLSSSIIKSNFFSFSIASVFVYSGLG